MSLSPLVYYLVCKTKLESDRPDADPADVNRLSILAAASQGVAGLILPFVVENNLPTKEPTKLEINDQIREAEAQIEVLKKQVEGLKAKLKTLGEQCSSPGSVSKPASP